MQSFIISCCLYEWILVFIKNTAYIFVSVLLEFDRTAYMWLTAVLDTVDFVLDDGTIVFRTCSAEHDKVVFQIVRIILSSALRYRL